MPPGRACGNGRPVLAVGAHAQRTTIKCVPPPRTSRAGYTPSSPAARPAASRTRSARLWLLPDPPHPAVLPPPRRPAVAPPLRRAAPSASGGVGCGGGGSAGARRYALRCGAAARGRHARAADVGAPVRAAPPVGRRRRPAVAPLPPAAVEAALGVGGVAPLLWPRPLPVWLRRGRAAAGAKEHHGRPVGRDGHCRRCRHGWWRPRTRARPACGGGPATPRARRRRAPHVDTRARPARPRPAGRWPPPWRRAATVTGPRGAGRPRAAAHRRRWAGASARGSVGGAAGERRRRTHTGRGAPPPGPWQRSLPTSPHPSPPPR